MKIKNAEFRSQKSRVKGATDDRRRETVFRKIEIWKNWEMGIGGLFHYFAIYPFNLDSKNLRTRIA